MDLKILLNPLPEPQNRPQISNNNGAPQNEIQTHQQEQQQQPNIHSYSRFFLSPRKIDPETASISTNSSTKRRRTNRTGRLDVEHSRPRNTTSAPMSRTFSEIQVPSDTSSLSDEQTVKRGVASISLQGTFSCDCADVDDMRLTPGARVEALKAGTQGTWYVARIIEFATFPAEYIDGPGSVEAPNQEYPMVCVHYEGTILSRIAAYNRVLPLAISMDPTELIAFHIQRGGYVCFRMDEL